ncbi:MAG: M20/M25/M40 family metallo-hydrolase [Halobaculum sp.]
MDASSVIADRLDDYRESLFDLLGHRTISTTGEGMAAGAEAVTEFLSHSGFDTRRIETSRYPLVYGEWTPDDATEPDRPTVVFYGHYDVQPADDPAAWDSPPFEPTVRDGAIYARGAGDNKGQFVAHAFALDALVRAGEAPDVTVKLLLEGGEESGSLGLKQYLGVTADDRVGGEAAHSDAATHSETATDSDAVPDEIAPEIADADLVYVADGPQHRSGRPTIIYGNRGILTFELRHETAAEPLHSGNFGGPVPNAATELVETLASMVDGDRVTVEGFHDGISVSDRDRELIDRLPDDENAIREELGIDRLATERDYYERLFTRPTLTINGIEGGYTGEGHKTVLPNEARATCDCRLVPGQDPDRVFETIRAHVNRVRPEITVERGTAFPPMKTPADTPVAEPVRAALREVWDDDPVELPVLGGSLPAAFFRSVPSLSDVPVLVVPYANPDQGNHSPNEHLDVRCFENGIRTSAAVLRRLGE